MDFDEHQQVDVSQVDDQRGSGGGGFGGGGGMGSSRGGFPIPMGRAGGGMGMLVIVAVLLLKACAGGGGGNLIDPSSLGQGSVTASAQGDNSNLTATCKADTNWSDRQDCRTVAVVNSVQSYWTDAFSRYTDSQYTKADTTLFSGGVNTGCGQATSEVGPFYCPRDQHVYVDLDFFGELQSKFGAKGGDFAEAYVVAHEYGHHVQNLLGTSAKVERAGGETGPESPSVRLELQADCFAGVWAANATSGPSPLIKGLSNDDITEGLDAASAVGDDRIQKKMQGRVNPEGWTHGSAAQRQKWFLTGFNSGEPAQCDTFNATTL
jgi:uncharacterized protein